MATTSAFIQLYDIVKHTKYMYLTAELTLVNGWDTGVCSCLIPLGANDLSSVHWLSYNQRSDSNEKRGWGWKYTAFKCLKIRSLFKAHSFVTIHFDWKTWANFTLRHFEYQLCFLWEIGYLTREILLCSDVTHAAATENCSSFICIIHC